MFILLLFILIKTIQGGIFNSKIFKHPISIAVFVYLGWMLITSLSSSMPLVSFKHFIGTMLVYFSLIFSSDIAFQKSKVYLLVFRSLRSIIRFVIFFSINNQLNFGLFDRKAAHFVMKPFYNDHTSYGAVLAMFIPVLTGLLFLKKIKIHLKIVIAY